MISWPGLAAAVPCFTIVFFLVSTWISPSRVQDGEWVALIFPLLMLEFIALHSGAFVGGFLAKRLNVTRKTFIFLVLLCWYGAFAIALSIGMKNWAFFWAYLAIMLGRIVSGILSNHPEPGRLLVRRSVVGAVLFLVTAFVSAFSGFIPRMGLTNDAFDQAFHFHRAPFPRIEANTCFMFVVWGILYFTAMGIAEFRLERRVRNPLT